MIKTIAPYRRNYQPDTRPVFWCTSNVKEFNEGAMKQMRKNKGSKE